MKKLISIALFAAIVLGSVQVGATGVLWSKSSLSEGEVVATFTGLDAGDRVAVGVYSDGVFSKMDMKYAENENEELSLVITNEEDLVRAFVWEQDSMRPKYVGSSYLTESGIKDENALFSDNQMINNVNAVGYKTIETLKDDYQITFNLTVAEKGDNAIILGDSANGTIGYGEASAILQFIGDNFTTRRGDGAGNYSEDAVTICPVSLGIAYTITIQGNVSTNTYMIKIYDGEQTYTSPMMTARTDATTGIDTIAFINNSKSTIVNDDYYSGFNFYGTNFEISTEEIEATPLYTYDGFEGLYYGLQLTSTGKYIRGNNGALTADYNSVSSNEAMFIPRDMEDGSHSFICKSSNNRITTSSAIGVTLSSSAYAYDNSQHWILEESENYSEDNKTYYLKHIDSNNYVGTSGNSLALVAEANKKEIRFVPLNSESPLYLISQKNVYNLLSSSQRERLETVYESVAGDVFGRYGGYSEWTPRIRMDNLFNEILTGNFTEAEQLSKIEAFLERGNNSHIYDGQASYQTVSTSLPGTAGLYWEIDTGTAGTYDFWRGTMLDGVLYKYKIYTAEGQLQQTINLYVQNDGTAQRNAETFKNIIIQIPHIFRRNLSNVKVRSDSANSYNGGGGDMYIRLNWSPDANSMRSTVVHELGHIISSNNGGWAEGSGWANAIALDMYAPSTYGATNATEDFAEFSRMYFAAYGNPDMQRGLKVIMPERYASFGRLRKNNLGGWGLWEDEYTN